MQNSLFLFLRFVRICISKCWVYILILVVTGFGLFASISEVNANEIIDASEKSNAKPASSKKQFMEQRYRGWLWFEEKQLEKPTRKIETSITPNDAKKEIEELKERMEEKRNVMMARPSPETVRDYVELEEVMWKKAMQLDGAYRQAKFRYPQYFDKLQDPQNVHAVKFKRKLDSEASESKIRDFATKFDLVFFSRGNCGYCTEFAPVLKRFSDMYGFSVEEASIDGDMSGLFKGRKMTDLAHKLGIEATPTVVAVSKDGKNAFELIRGYVAVAELEEYVGLAVDYVKSQQLKALSKRDLSGITRRVVDE
jgi:conjugal transfer pilus assembly protein TraF